MQTSRRQRLSLLLWPLEPVQHLPARRLDRDFPALLRYCARRRVQAQPPQAALSAWKNPCNTPSIAAVFCLAGRKNTRPFGAPGDAEQALSICRRDAEYEPLGRRTGLPPGGYWQRYRAVSRHRPGEEEIVKSPRLPFCTKKPPRFWQPAQLYPGKKWLLLSAGLCIIVLRHFWPKGRFVSKSLTRLGIFVFP